MESSQISSIISATINEMFYKIFSSIDNSLYSVLDDFTFIDSDILNDSYFIDIFGLSSQNGILLIANSLVLGYLIYYAFKLLLSHLGVTQVERSSQFILKLIIYPSIFSNALFKVDINFGSAASETFSKMKKYNNKTLIFKIILFLFFINSSFKIWYK